MKKLLLVVLALSAISGIAAEQKKQKPTREYIERRKLEHFGGFIYQPVETTKISIVDESGKANSGLLTIVSTTINQALRYPVVIGKDDKTGLSIKIVECDKIGPLAVMPDSAEVLVNIKALSKDSPDQQKLNNRISKEIWRGLIYVLGGGNTYTAQCVMKPVASLADLDALPATMACPEAYMRITEGAAKFGLKAERRVSYRQACKEGWAPAPANDIQRKVWERVQAEKSFEAQTKDPTKPIKIKYNKK